MRISTFCAIIGETNEIETELYIKRRNFDACYNTGLIAGTTNVVKLQLDLCSYRLVIRYQ